MPVLKPPRELPSCVLSPALPFHCIELLVSHKIQTRIELLNTLLTKRLQLVVELMSKEESFLILS